MKLERTNIVQTTLITSNDFKSRQMRHKPDILGINVAPNNNILKIFLKAMTYSRYFRSSESSKVSSYSAYVIRMFSKFY